MEVVATTNASLPPVLEDVEMESQVLGKSISRRPCDNELRILIFTACYFVLDGVTLTIRRLESYLRSRGATVKILSTVPDDYDAEATKDIIVVPGIKIPFTHAGTGYAFGAGLDENTIKEIDRFKPNCIHFTVPDLVGLDGIKYCQRKGIAYMATWHSNYVDYLQYYFLDWLLKPGFLRYLQGFYGQMPYVYVPTSYMIEKMTKEGFAGNSELVEWGRGCDLKLFSPDRRSSAFRTARGFSETDVVVLWVGRIVPEKRPDIWMNVLSRFYQEGLPVKGLVVGHGTYEAVLSEMPNVTCCGWLSGVGLAEAYASADILLFPSAVETFGNVTLEALASGCVCVVEDLCGGHLVTSGQTGFTVQADDTENFYLATRRLVTDTALRKVMSQHAREFSYRYERNKILQQMAEFYKDAIVRHSDPSYIKDRLNSSPEAAGRNILSVMCCNYVPIKYLAEPFLSTTSNLQNLAYSSNECIQVNRNRLGNCCTSVATYCPCCGSSSNYAVKGHDDELMRGVQTPRALIIVKLANWCGSFLAYALIVLIVYASFTV